MTAAQIQALTPSTDFFIGIDSDGCVFDNMEIKHKECFCPAFIDRFELQPISRYAREAWEFVNLYSRTRGFNRFPCVVQALNLLRRHAHVRDRGFEPMRLPGLEAWIGRESRLSNPSLEAALRGNPDPDLERALAWSHDVNKAVKKIVRGIAPFRAAIESLKALHGKADVVVVSQTPAEAIQKEWGEHGMDRYIRAVAGQEVGTKAESIRFGSTGRYRAHCVLMIGDSHGDFAAARESGARYYPIVPGREDESWERFRDEAMARFLDGGYTADYEASLIAEFDEALPRHAPWEIPEA